MNEWLKHLMAYKKAHPKLSLSACMKAAAKTYRKK